MLRLAAELSDGAIPAMVEPSVTAEARTALGNEKLLVVLIDGGRTAGDPADIAAVAAAHRGLVPTTWSRCSRWAPSWPQPGIGWKSSRLRCARCQTAGGRTHLFLMPETS